MEFKSASFFGPNHLARRVLAGGVAFVYGITNVAFCHAAESNFWSSRRTVARQMSKSSPAPAPASTDALILAQLPGGARLDFQRPVESSVVPTVAPQEHLVGGKIPVFESDLPRWLADVIAPYGNMRDVFLSKRPGAPLVIQIQDLHDSSEAQRNIAGLVEALQDERGVNLVGLEGAQGAFATEAFRSFPDADITKAVADHFMEQGYLGGPEFAGITAKRMPLLWGVEDMKGYDANVEAVKHAAKNRPVMDRFLQEARRVMNEVKDRRLSVKLLEFDRHLTGYHLGKEPLGTYVRYLLKSSPLSMAHVPNLVLLRDALRWEEMLDFKRIEMERANLLERMVRSLSKESLDRLVARSASYRLGRVTYGEYYRFLRTLCTESGISLEDYGQLSAYVRYVLLAERINRNDLLTELGALERAVQDSLAVTAEEKRIVSSARNLALLERLVRHAYTPADWAYQTTHAEEIRNVGAAIVTLAQQVGVPHTLSPPGMDVLAPYEDFCRQAVGRNAAMVQNLLAKMQTEKRTTAVLVAGGFHTEGLTQLLRQKDISYAVVTPKVNGPLPEGQRSLDLLARDPAPLEKLFAGETVNIPTERMVSGGGSNWAKQLRLAFAIFLLSIIVVASDSPVKLQDPAGFSAARIAGVESSKAVPEREGVVKVTIVNEGAEKEYLVGNVQAVVNRSYDGSIKIQPEKMTVTAVPDALSFRENIRSWGKALSDRFAKVRTALASTLLSKIPGVWDQVVDFISARAKVPGEKSPWETFLVLIGLGGMIRRVSSQGVAPVSPVSRPGSSTEAPEPRETTVISEEGQILEALENLAGELTEQVGLNDLISRIFGKQLLEDLPEPLRKKVTEVLFNRFAKTAQQELLISVDMIGVLVASLKEEATRSSLYDLQKPTTYQLLENWKSSTDRTIIGSIKRFLVRHDILGTAIIEELGLFEQGKTKLVALLEGRVPMVVVGTVLGGLMLLFPAHGLVFVFSGLAIGLIWPFLSPQRQFVMDHGEDQTRLQIVVRTGGTFILNLAALSVSWAVVLAGVGFGFDAKFFILLIVSPAVALIAVIFTHAFFEILDILPDSTPVQKNNFPEGTPGTDPLGTPPTKEAEADALIKKLSGKTIEELNQIIRVVADHDLGGSVNDLAGKHTIGVSGESKSVHIVGASRNFSPYWWQRRWIRVGVVDNGGEITKGPGGDDYKMFFDESSFTSPGKSVETSLSEIVDEENKVMRDQFVFYSVESPEFRGDESREKKFLAAIKNKFEIELSQEGRIIIVRHGNGVTIAVKKISSDEKLASIEARLSRLGAGSRWRRLDQMRPGLGLFSYSMGGLRMGDLVQRLLEAYPNLQLLDSDGKLLKEGIPVVMTWADRLAEDMLSVAKGRGRKQVFVADALETIKTYERPGTVTEENISQTISGKSGEVRPAFSVPMADEFWKDAKKQGEGHVVVFEVAQYRTQDLRWRVNATSEWILRHLPRFLFKAVPERWVRSLEKRIQSRAFHAWQGSDQHGKGNDAIAAHYEMVVGVEEGGAKFGRAVDTFFAHSRAPPSIEDLSKTAVSMKNKLKSQHPNETKIDPFHVVYDLNLADWTKFLKDRQGMHIEDVLAMQNAVVTYLGRRYGEEPLIEKLREIFTVERGTNVLLLSMDVTKPDAADKFRKLELLFRKAQAENARAAELVLNARPPIRMGSFAFSWLAKGVEKVFKVSPARARQIVSGRYVQSFIVSAIELPFLPYLAVGLTIAMGSFLGPWGAILAASIIMALIHGKPVMTRGPPEFMNLVKDKRGRPIENDQTIKQFTIRFLGAFAINTFALFVGGLDPTLLLTPGSLSFESLNLWDTGSSAYLSHALFNFLVPESYRLSLAVGSQPTNFEEIVESVKERDLKWNEVKAAYADWLRENVGDRQADRFLHVLDTLPFVPYDKEGKWLPEQPELYMKAVLQSLREEPVTNLMERKKTPKGASSPRAPFVIDSVVLEALFYYTRSTLTQMLKEKKEKYIDGGPNWSLSPEEKKEVLRSAIGFSTLAARLGWGKIATDVAMELWEPEKYHSTAAAYEDRLRMTETQRKEMAEKINDTIGRTLNNSVIILETRAKGVYSLLNKILRGKRDNSEYNINNVQDFFTTKIVLDKPGNNLKAWREKVSEIKSSIASELGVEYETEPDDRKEWGGGATYITLFVPFKNKDGNPLPVDKNDPGTYIPLELQFFSLQRYQLLNLGAGKEGYRSLPYWIYKANDFIANVFTVQKLIRLKAISYPKSNEWKDNLAQLALAWSEENVVQVVSSDGTSKYIELPGKGAEASRFIDLAGLADKIHWDRRQLCHVAIPRINGKDYSLENPVPLGAIVLWNNHDFQLLDAARAQLIRQARLPKTICFLTRPVERKMINENFDQQMNNALTGMAKSWRSKSLNTTELLQKFRFMLKEEAELHSLTVDEFKLLLNGNPALLLGRPSTSGKEKSQNREFNQARTKILAALGVSVSNDQLGSVWDRSIIDLLEKIGVLTEEESSALSTELRGGSKVKAEVLRGGVTKIEVMSSDRPGLFNKCMKVIAGHNAILVSAHAREGKPTIFMIRGSKDAKDLVGSSLLQVPNEGYSRRHSESRKILVEIDVAFNGLGGNPIELDLTSLTKQFSSFIAGNGGDIREIEIDSVLGRQKFRLVVALSEKNFRELETSPERSPALAAINRELEQVHGDLNVKLISTGAEPAVVQPSVGSWSKNKIYQKYVAWWLETPLLFLGLYYIHEPLTALLWGMPVLAGLLYPFLFVLGHVFNLKALKGPAVWELAGWKLLLGPLAFSLAPTGLTGILLFLVVGIVGVVTVRHRELNLGKKAFSIRDIFALGKGKEISLHGAGNGIEGAVMAKAMLVEPEEFGGEIYPVYSLEIKGESSEQTLKRVTLHQRRVDEAFQSLSADKGMANKIPAALEMGAIEQRIKNRIAEKKLNAQAMVVEELDLSIAGERDLAKQGQFKNLKSILIEFLGERHTLAAPDDPNLESLKNEEIQRMQGIAAPIWRIVTGDKALSEFPQDYQEGGSANDRRLGDLHAAIKDALFGFGVGSVRGNKSAVAVLREARNGFLDAIREIRGELKQKADEYEDEEGILKKNSIQSEIESLEHNLQTLEDYQSTFLIMIGLLNPNINHGSNNLELARFGAAVNAIEGILKGRKTVVRGYLKFLNERGSALISTNRSAVNAIALLTNQYLYENSGTLDSGGRDEISHAKKVLENAIENPENQLNHELAGQEVVVVSKEPLTPSQLSEIENWGCKVVGVVMLRASQAMHGPIAVKSAGYPCVVGVVERNGLEEFWSNLKRGEDIAVFAEEGRVVFSPNKSTRNDVTRSWREAAVFEELYAQSRKKPNGVVTLLSSPDDLKSIADTIERGAQGVGLRRTEHDLAAAGIGDVPALMVGGQVNEYFETYLVSILSNAARQFWVTKGKYPFKVRMFDYDPNPNEKFIGSLPHSELRGAQYILSDKGRPFAYQEIHAVMKAYLISDNIQLFFPMVSDRDEGDRLREMVKKVMNNKVGGLSPFTSTEQEKLKDLLVGAMAENGASVKNIEDLLEIFDFINIGTKDLTLDLFNKKSEDSDVSELLEKLNRNVINSILIILESAKARGKPVTACGVLAGNEIFIPVAILLAKDYGMDLSVPPTEVDKWNYLITKILNMEDDLAGLRKLIEQTGVDNSDEMTDKAQDIVQKAKKAIRESQEFKQTYARLYGKVNYLKWVLLGGVGLILLFATMLAIPGPLDLPVNVGEGLSNTPFGAGSVFLGVGAFDNLAVSLSSILQAYSGFEGRLVEAIGGVAFLGVVRSKMNGEVGYLFEEYEARELSEFINDGPAQTEFESAQKETIEAIIAKFEESLKSGFVLIISEMKTIRKKVSGWLNSGTKDEFLSRINKAIDIAEIVGFFDSIIYLTLHSNVKENKELLERKRGETLRFYTELLKKDSKFPEDMWGLVLLDILNRSNDIQELKVYQGMAILLFNYSLRKEIPYAYKEGKKSASYVNSMVSALKESFGGNAVSPEFDRDKFAEALDRVREGIKSKLDAQARTNPVRRTLAAVGLVLLFSPVLVCFLSGNLYAADGILSGSAGVQQLAYLFMLGVGGAAAKRVVSVAGRAMAPTGVDVSEIISALRNVSLHVAYINNREKKLVANYIQELSPKFELENREPAYIITVLQTVALVKLAELREIDSGFVERQGLSFSAVNALFNAGVDAKEIQRIQFARFNTLISLRDDFRITPENVFPLNSKGLEKAINIRGSGLGGTISESKERIRLRLESLRKEGNNDGIGGKLAGIALQQFNEGEAFRPNPLAVAIEEIISPRTGKGFSLSTARRNFAQHLIGKFLDNPESQTSNEAMRTLTNAKMKDYWKMLSLLFGMNGSLSEDQSNRDHSEEKAPFLQRLYQVLDIQLFANLSSLLGEELETSTEDLQSGVAAFNEVAVQASLLRDPIAAVDAQLRSGLPIALFISPQVARGEKENLTAAEKTLVEAIFKLDRRLADNSDPVAAKWLSKPGNSVGIAVLDTDTAYQYSLDDVLIHLETLAGKSLAGIPSASKGFGVFRGARGEGAGSDHIVVAKDVLEKLEINAEQVAITAVEVKGISVNYESVRARIASLILAMNGGLMCEVAPMIVDKLKAIRLKATHA